MTGGGKDHIGPYRLLRLIQAGKITQVWEAMNATEHRRVALKILRADYAKDRGHLASMKHEFAVGHSLDHPKVNKLIELDLSRSTPYLIMEYFPAPNLKSCVRQNLPQIKNHLALIVRSAAEAIGHMHERGWVHRDIKPENLLVAEDGDLRLIDFAIAQRVMKSGMLGKLFGSKQVIQGTRSYMSPEQIRGGDIDFRSDIYSFGCTLFEVVAGKPPYTGTNADDLLNRHLKSQVPSAAASRPDLTPEFSRLISSMLAKQPEDRPASMQKFLESFDQMRILKLTA